MGVTGFLLTKLSEDWIFLQILQINYINICLQVTGCLYFQGIV